MKSDKTTKILLALIALALWFDIAERQGVVHAQIQQKASTLTILHTSLDHPDNTGYDVHAILEAIESIERRLR